jgi:hypothetical protein
MWKSETARLALAKEPSLLPNAAGDKKKAARFGQPFFYADCLWDVSKYPSGIILYLLTGLVTI